MTGFVHDVLLVPLRDTIALKWIVSVAIVLLFASMLGCTPEKTGPVDVAEPSLVGRVIEYAGVIWSFQSNYDLEYSARLSANPMGGVDVSLQWRAIKTTGFRHPLQYMFGGEFDWHQSEWPANRSEFASPYVAYSVYNKLTDIVGGLPGDLSIWHPARDSWRGVMTVQGDKHFRHTGPGYLVAVGRVNSDWRRDGQWEARDVYSYEGAKRLTVGRVVVFGEYRDGVRIGKWYWFDPKTGETTDTVDFGEGNEEDAGDPARLPPLTLDILPVALRPRARE